MELIIKDVKNTDKGGLEDFPSQTCIVDELVEELSTGNFHKNYGSIGQT